MRKIVLSLHTGYAGMDAHEGWIIPADMSEDDIYQWAYEIAVDHASSYGIYPVNDYEDMSEEELESEGIDLNDWHYTDNIEGSFEDYNPKKHDGKLLFGISKEVHWNTY